MQKEKEITTYLFIMLSCFFNVAISLSSSPFDDMLLSSSSSRSNFSRRNRFSMSFLVTDDEVDVDDDDDELCIESTSFNLKGT